MSIQRTLYEKIWRQLSRHKQMVFIAGPRQAGKTTFTRMLADSFTNSLYFNWDILDEKRKPIENPAFYESVHRGDDSPPLIVFDELHKYANWKNYLKSVYDRDKGNYVFVVSGSARLDMYQKGGDSLAGRYFLFYLWPFTVAELAGNTISFDAFMADPVHIRPAANPTQPIWERLNLFSGFPDPYLDGTDAFYRVWSNTYRKQLLREDMRDLASVRNMEGVEILFSLLPSRVGSPLSMASLSRDIGVSFDSIRNWLDLFENFFMAFRIVPWSKKISRAITKEKKLYLFDYGGIESEAARFENGVAVELFRAVSNWNDRGLGRFSLNYLRNREKEEVDFLITRDRRPFLMIETKLSDETTPRSLIKFQKALNIPAVHLVNTPDVCKLVSNEDLKILVVSAGHWLSQLP